LAAPSAIIILVAHVKGTVASGNLRKVHINELKFEKTQEETRKTFSFITSTRTIIISRLERNHTNFNT
jgi:hypothetical protein